MERSFVIMAFRNAGRDAIQSESLCPSNALSRIPSLRTGQAPKHRCSSSLAATQKQPEIKRRILHELGTVPISQIASKRTCGPPCKDTTDASGPAASRIFAKIVASRVVLALNRLNTATQTRRNTDLFHVFIITQFSEPRFSNSMLHCPCAFTQPITRERMRGYIPLKMND